ncbi:hypothetical protein ACJMK2_037718 [Sinanodonta woodiana]|uniref:BZIP domain-containing protein n=1 Tax=Sinanodonta woodiana TaxID=1069815 RepID=A0ABD3WPU5_SINWO
MADDEVHNGVERKSTTPIHRNLNGYKIESSFEQKQHLECVKSSDSKDEFVESPLDFSIKKKGYDGASGSESVSSPASTSDTGCHLEDRRTDFDENLCYINGGREPGEKVSQIGQSNILNSDVYQSSSYANMSAAMLSGLRMGMIPDVNMLASFPAMAALMDPRRAQGGKTTRPFKAYPKEPLSLPVGNFGIPNYMAAFPNFDANVLQGMNLTSDELFNIYKQQLTVIREREKHIESIRASHHRTSTMTSPNRPQPPGPSPSSTSGSTVSTPNSTNVNNGVHISAASPSTPTSITSVTASGRKRPRSLPDEQKDESYWERRRKNNDAAKRSRDARRAKEDEIAIRAALLEQENLKLRVEVAALKSETAKLRCMLYNS